MTKEELNVVLDNHKLWIKGSPKGIRANFSEANLSWANFSGANLSWANFSEANLSLANFSGANLREANLSGANLSWANLSGANLSWANLSGANLDYSVLNLSCKSKGIKVDGRIFRQILGHLLALEVVDNDTECINISKMKSLLKCASKGHRAKDLMYYWCKSQKTTKGETEV